MKLGLNTWLWVSVTWGGAADNSLLKPLFLYVAGTWSMKNISCSSYSFNLRRWSLVNEGIDVKWLQPHWWFLLNPTIIRQWVGVIWHLFPHSPVQQPLCFCPSLPLQIRKESFDFSFAPLAAVSAAVITEMLQPCSQALLRLWGLDGKSDRTSVPRLNNLCH